MAYTPRTENLINLKIKFDGHTQRFTLPLRELVPSILPVKLCQFLDISLRSKIVLERYSDSARAYVVLDQNIFASYKKLYRAARTKSRLRIRVTIVNQEKTNAPYQSSAGDETTVLSNILPSLKISDVNTRGSKTQLFSPVSCSEKKLNPAPDVPRSLSVSLTSDRVSSGAATSPVVSSHNKIDPNTSTTMIQSEMLKKEENTSLCETISMNNQIHDTIMFSNALLNPGKCPILQKIVTTNGRKMATTLLPAALHSLSIICNNCNSFISAEHYHCSNCDGGDYDLCQECVDNGILCYNENHWLIKRYIKDGEPINSTTQTFSLKSYSKSKDLVCEKRNTQIVKPTRTCNCCIAELAEDHFVTCTTCPDYNLCISCHVALNHGHHPRHAFEPVVRNQSFSAIAKSLLAPGRNVKHEATCDSCEEIIYGIRHKCLDCPDWDYCSSCFSSTKNTHTSHRFVPIFEPLQHTLECSRPYFFNKGRHYGVFCDGPLCKNISSYIYGDRYKCAVCDDIDFCASCEACPENMHDPTHSLIKLKTPVHRISVTTSNKENEQPMSVSDKNPQGNHGSVEVPLTQSTNTATLVQTIFDLKPSENLRAEHVENETNQLRPNKTNDFEESWTYAPENEVIAHFIRDVIIDGTTMLPNLVFEQTWYLRNAGKKNWPPGCYVKFFSGTDMCIKDTYYSESTHDLVSTTRTSVCESVVIPGQTVGFTVLLKSPLNAGNFVSFWRLATPDNRVVGPRLWCEINVKEPVSISDKESSLVTSSNNSCLIFPKFEKEYTHIQNDGESITDIVAHEEDFDDPPEEDLVYLDSFETEDEYDILDASDEEYSAEQHNKY